MSEATVRVLPVRPKALTVSELNRAVKGAIEQEFPAVWVEGEITSCKIAASGHAYFDLKDDKEDARVSCCLFKNALAKSRATIRDGERVLLRARASLYPARGSFQLIVETVLAAGAGNAAAQLEALKRKLADEGLLALERKRALPRFPRVVGVVTALSGAAVADICRVLHRRWPVRVVIANTLVQGTDAPVQIVSAIRAIQRVAELDVLIVGRGGGASDDLSAFNDERVARAIAACRVPVVSAVGHEVDHTIADLVADVRAATPSNAAELCVPERRVIEEELRSQQSRLLNAIRTRVANRKVALVRYEKRLGDPRRFTEEIRQRLDEGLARITLIARRKIQVQRRVLEGHNARLQRAHPKARLARDRGALQALTQRLGPALRMVLADRSRVLEESRARLAPATRAAVLSYRTELARRVAQMDALSPLSILARGYGVVLSKGHALTDATQVGVGDVLHIRLAQGALEANVTAVQPSNDEKK